ncbi:hypothetical protein MTO96_014357, partial [Rhipicephalus appendiculatus]
MDLVKKYPSDLANTFPDELEQFISYASNEAEYRLRRKVSVGDGLLNNLRRKLRPRFPESKVSDRTPAGLKAAPARLSTVRRKVPVVRRHTAESCHATLFDGQ